MRCNLMTSSTALPGIVAVLARSLMLVSFTSLLVSAIDSSESFALLTPDVGSAVPTAPVSPAPVSVKPNWQRFFVCDQGKTWVDVDLNERRNLQVVSRDTAANQYFAEQAVIISPTTPAPLANADLSQAVFRLHQDSGVFKASDFSVANNQESATFKSPLKVADDYMTQFSVISRAFRDANRGGLTLEFVRVNMQICNFYDLNTQSCSGDLTYSIPSRYIGTWFFATCQTTGL